MWSVMTFASAAGSFLASCAAFTLVLFQEGHTRLCPRTCTPFWRSQSITAIVPGRDASFAHCGHLVSFSITEKLNSFTICSLYFASVSAFMRPLENEAPLTAVPHRNPCFFICTETSAPRTGLPALSFTETVRSPLRYLSMRASAALRHAALGSLPAYPSLVYGRSATFLLVP